MNKVTILGYVNEATFAKISKILFNSRETFVIDYAWRREGLRDELILFCENKSVLEEVLSSVYVENVVLSEGRTPHSAQVRLEN